MKVKPENVSGKLVESHEFTHQVKHQVNWSHILLGIVAIYVIARLGPVMVGE
jgi:hypothetical protein